MKGFNNSSSTNNTPKLGGTNSQQDMSSTTSSPQLSSPSLPSRRRQSTASVKSNSVHFSNDHHNPSDIAADQSNSPNPNQVIPSGQPKKLRKQINTTAFKQNYFELDLTSSSEAKLLQFTPGMEKKKKASSRSRSSSSAASSSQQQQQQQRRKSDATNTTKKRKKPSKNSSDASEQEDEESCNNSDHHEENLSSPNLEGSNKRRNSTGSSLLTMSTSNVASNTTANTTTLNVPSSTSFMYSQPQSQQQTQQHTLSDPMTSMIKHKPIYNEYNKKLYTAREDTAFSNIFTTSTTSFSTSSVPSSLKKANIQLPSSGSSTINTTTLADQGSNNVGVLSSILSSNSCIAAESGTKIEKLMNEPMPLIYYLNAMSSKKEELQHQQNSTSSNQHQTNTNTTSTSTSTATTSSKASSYITLDQGNAAGLSVMNHNQQQQQHMNTLPTGSFHSGHYSLAASSSNMMMMNMNHNNNSSNQVDLMQMILNQQQQQDTSMDIPMMSFSLMDAEHINELQSLLNELESHSSSSVMNSSNVAAARNSSDASAVVHQQQIPNTSMDSSSFQQLCFSISQSAKNGANLNNVNNNTSNSNFFNSEMNGPWDEDILNTMQQHQQQQQLVLQPSSFSTSTAPPTTTNFLDDETFQLGMNINQCNNFDPLFNLDNLYRAITSSSNATSAAGSEASSFSYNQFDLSEQLQSKSAAGSMFFFE
ncbi:hypothetical protein FDP41_013689 [Naegleria fowleri]|uniref:Uncharacterized protein n=1 Tax=Naegleria fowleri TaxID=5763 RepID=A0A6A5C4S7_NAEFO|nr:uncharacterized protein FDP41_013689 [Naegleria fowleri]KAF0980475.1 hypothetical protein FDP41_013689 [Naegleria fowleri]